MLISKTMIFLSFFVAFGASFLITPLAIKIAPKIGAMDVPKDGRRMHKDAIPRFGGIALFAGIAASILIFLHGNDRVMTALLGGTIIYVIGLTDDLKNLDAKIKFICELFVAILMYAMGLRIHFIGNVFGDNLFYFGKVLCFVVTVLWIVGVTNTINIVDGLDGLAAGLAMIASLSIAYVAYIHGDRYGMLVICVAMMAIAGSSFGFLPYNFYPARIFMGDGGSLLLGFMIAVLSVVGPLKRSTFIAVVVPVIVLAIPLFDTFFAIMRRAVNKKPIMGADKGHLHHHLMESGYGQRRAVLMLYGISAIMGMAAVLTSRELYKDAFVLAMITLIYLYVFLTDTSQMRPHIRNRGNEQDEQDDSRRTDEEE